MSCIIFDKQHEDHPWCSDINDILSKKPDPEYSVEQMVTANVCLDGRINNTVQQTLVSSKIDNFANFQQSWSNKYANLHGIWEPNGSNGGKSKKLPKQVKMVHVVALHSLVTDAIISKDAFFCEKILNTFEQDIQNKKIDKEDFNTLRSIIVSSNKLEKSHKTYIKGFLDRFLSRESAAEHDIRQFCWRMFSEPGIPIPRSYIWGAIQSDIQNIDKKLYPYVLGLPHVINQDNWLLCFQYVMPSNQLYVPTCIEAGLHAAHYPTHRNAGTGLTVDLRYDKESYPQPVKELVHTPPKYWRLKNWIDQDIIFREHGHVSDKQVVFARKRHVNFMKKYCNNLAPKYADNIVC